MPRPDKAQRAQELRESIHHHDYRYYVLDDPEISDAAYDALYAELRHLEEKHPELITEDSPTQRVGGIASSQFRKVQHKRPMLSLQNAFDEAEIRAWDKRVRAVTGPKVAYVGELKIDGLAISLTYRKDKSGQARLVQAATRGDGQVGEEVTANVRTIRSVPLVISPLPGLPEEFEVRGEVYMPLWAFERVNQEMTDSARGPFMNPRNAAAGSVRQLDSRITARRHLHTYMYSLDPAGSTQSQWEVLEGLATMGFRVNPNRGLFNSVEEVITYHQRWKEQREQLDHEIDGVVIKVNTHSDQLELGFVSRSPRWAIAFKYAPEVAETVIENIICSVGRTGVLTPVAQLEPVLVGGVTVRNAVLHNEQVVNQKGAYPGARALVQRAGDVIPEVVRVIDPRPGWKMSERCPVCGGQVIREEPYVAHRCINPFCPAQQLERLRHFTSRPAMDIGGLGPATLTQLLDQKLINDPADIYRLTQEQLENLERFAKKSAHNLIQQIESSRNPPLSRFLYALGIPQIGSATADLLAAHFGDLSSLRKAELNDLVEVEGVGENMATGILAFLNSQGGELIDRLLEVGVKPQSIERISNPAVSGKTVVFTGSLEQMSRQEAEELVRRLGGRASSSISARTDYVVAGPGAGSKLDKARELKLNILEEADFFKLLEDS